MKRLVQSLLKVLNIPSLLFLIGYITALSVWRPTTVGWYDDT
jgi:hypothetical protein